MFESSLNNPINIFPDYNSGISASSGFIAPKDGYVLIRQLTNGGAANSSISGVDTAYQGTERATQVDRLFPISKGETIKATLGSMSNLKYFPCFGG